MSQQSTLAPQLIPINHKFGNWIMNQQNRGDDIGYLARVLAAEGIKPQSSKRNEHKYWVDVIIKIGNPHYIVPFNEAWQEYLQTRQAAI